MIQRHCVSHHIFGCEPPLDAIYLNGVKRVARPGDKAILHSLFAPGKMHLRLRAARRYLACNCQCGVDMPGSAAGGN